MKKYLIITATSLAFVSSAAIASSGPEFAEEQPQNVNAGSIDTSTAGVRPIEARPDRDDAHNRRIAQARKKQARIKAARKKQARIKAARKKQARIKQARLKHKRMKMHRIKMARRKAAAGR